MATEFGKLLRIWRIELGVTMAKMARSLDLSTAYLSAIELGKKKIPEDFIQLVSEYFKLSNENIEKLHEAAMKSNDEVKIRLSTFNSQDQNNVLAFARKYEGLSDEKKEQLRRLLNSDSE